VFCLWQEMAERAYPAPRPLLCRDCLRRLPAPREDESPLEYCAACLSKRLAERTESIVELLLPNGHYEGQWYRTGSIEDEPGQSLAVSLNGKRRGRYYDFAAASGGDLLDMFRLKRCDGDMLSAMRLAQDWLRLPVAQPDQTRKQQSKLRTRASDAELRIAALRIWGHAVSLVPDDMASRYLQGRLRTITAQFPPALRFHPNLRHPSGRRFPALVAAVAGPDARTISGIHRTFLTELEGGEVVKAPVKKPKMALGPISGGMIWLSRGASDRPWHDPLPGSLIAIGEGVEDALTIAAERPDWRVGAAVALSNMISLRLPAAIAEVIFIAQNDPPGSQAAETAPRAIQHFRELGKTVWVLRPPAHTKDVNQLLQNFGLNQGRK